ncbi:MAG: glutamate-cysteine ligase family protein [Actinomycetes bacterium]
MTSDHSQLTIRDARRFVETEVFGNGHDPHGLGVELEWHCKLRDSQQRIPIERAHALIEQLTPLAGGGRLTIEPGGQLEISSALFHTIDEVCDATTADLFELTRVCADHEFTLYAVGTDATRPPHRVATHPRYVAMESYFEQFGPAGRIAMCNTAALQINIGLGDPTQAHNRWRLANWLGPTLIALFANSPLADGAPSHWKSTRLRSWWAADASRTAPVNLELPPIEAWTDYALNALVMVIRTTDGRFIPMAEPLRFGEWINNGHQLGWPTIDDFAYHLTTLFPPVRPKGWLELRMLDALPWPTWLVAFAVSTILLTDPLVTSEVVEALDGSVGLWNEAAEVGLANAHLRRSAQAIFDIAVPALASAEVDPNLQQLVADYQVQSVVIGQCPADLQLEAWHRGDELLSPMPAEPIDCR